MDLPVDHHGIQPRPAIIHRQVTDHPGSPGLPVDLDEGDVRPERPDEVRRVEERRRFHASLHSRRQPVRLECSAGDLLDRERFGGRALDEGLPALVNDVGFRRFQQVGGDLSRFFAYLDRAHVHRRAIHRCAPAAIGVHSHRTDRGITVHDIDVLEWEPQRVPDDLGEGGLVALSVG